MFFKGRELGDEIPSAAVSGVERLKLRRDKTRGRTAGVLDMHEAGSPYRSLSTFPILLTLIMWSSMLIKMFLLTVVTATE